MFSSTMTLPFFTFFTSYQIAASAFCAVVSGVLYVMWWKLDETRRQRIWQFYGWFCALTCIGMCALAFVCAAFVQYLKNWYSSDTNPDTGQHWYSSDPNPDISSGLHIQNLLNAQVSNFNHSLGCSSFASTHLNRQPAHAMS